MSAPSHERNQAVDQKIFKATLNLLATRGLMNLRILDVAKEAGVNKTSVYRRHKSIESIVIAAISNFAEHQIPLPDTGTLLEDFKELARSVKNLLQTPLGQALMHATGAAHLVQMRKDYWNARLAHAASLIERAALRGECSAVHHPGTWIESLVAPIHFRVFQTQGNVDHEFLDAQAKRVYRTLIAEHPPERSR